MDWVLISYIVILVLLAGTLTLNLLGPQKETIQIDQEKPQIEIPATLSYKSRTTVLIAICMTLLALMIIDRIAGNYHRKHRPKGAFGHEDIWEY